MYNLWTTFVHLHRYINYMKKKSKRLEFTADEIKQINKAAKIIDRTPKKFMELAVIAGTLQMITNGKT